MIMAAATGRIRPADDAAIADAARSIRAGRLVAFPTETVYGLGANACDDKAVAAIFAAKGRPSFNPLIVHVLDTEAAQAIAQFDAKAIRLAQAFWPGPLTLVVPRRETSDVSPLVSAGLDTIAVRSPSHPVARALLAKAATPIAAPSANPSGRLSPTSAQDVAEDLGECVDLILDGGTTPLGLESTIVGLNRGKPLLLRPGAIAREAIEAIIGVLSEPVNSKVQSPGQLESHYAPHAKLRLNAANAKSGEALLAFGPKAPRTSAVALNLSKTGDLNEAAANLFAMLRALDKIGAGRIAVMPIPSNGIGEAINDRLRRAAAPRPGGIDG